MLALLLMACSAGPTSLPTTTTTTPVSATPTFFSTLSPAPEREPLSQVAAVATPRVPRLRAGELQLAADIDDIPALFADDTLFVDTTAGDAEWSDDEFVIGVVLANDARAYPIRLLSLHEIVNDTIGGHPLAVTWCPLCFSAVVFDRVMDGRALTFGVSGLLYNNNLVMYDHQTDTLWSQLLGQGVRGALRGRTLGILPSLMTTWGDWKARHPDTRVLSAAATGRRADEVIDPYGGYYGSGSAGITGSSQNDGRLPVKELVVGLQIGAETRAYALRDIATAGTINDALGSLELALAYDAALDTAVVFLRRVDGRLLTLEPVGDGRLQDRETGTEWALDTGTAVAGPLNGAQLQRLSGPLVFWFAWSDIHPGADLYALP